MKFVDVKNDIAFRKIFGNQNKTEILISFLNAVLDLPLGKKITTISMRDPFQLPEIKELKNSILDVNVTDERGISYIVEMQVEEQKGFDKRVQYYTAKQYASQIEVGEDYPKLNQVIFIGILNFNFFEGDDYLTKHLIINQKSGKQELCDLEFNFIELPKFKEEELKIETLIEKWVYFIKKAPNLQVIPADIQDEGLLHAYEDASQFNWTKKELMAYDYVSMRRGDEKGVITLAVERAVEKAVEKAVETAVVKTEEKERASAEKVLKKALQKASLNEKIAIEKVTNEMLRKNVFNLYKNGVDLNTISLSLGITIEEVKSCLESDV